MTDPGLRTELSDGVLRVTIDRPSRMNALDDATCAALIDAFESAPGDEARVVILTGAGAAFCAGADVVDLAAAGPSDPVNPPDPVASARHTMDRAASLVRTVLHCPLPVIAQVNGPAVGIGASLALACDLVYASEDAYFLLAFTRVGLMPDGASSLLVPAAIGRARASAMMLLAQPIPADEACSVGLINEVLAVDRLQSRVDSAAKMLLRSPRRALELTKQALTATTLALLDDALEREAEGQVELLTSPEFAERVTALTSAQKGA
ncbi:MAG: enoyl-CoA hydratase-related protein [Rhodococcus sp. (in: high G+C Gram-positive bacteria)]